LPKENEPKEKALFIRVISILNFELMNLRFLRYFFA